MNNLPLFCATIEATTNGIYLSPEFKNKGPKDRNSMEKYVLAYSTN
jgi:hypothetical protein